MENIKIYSQNSCVTTNWSGGTTTQLFIYPNNGDYATRDFSVRISSATVETEHSKFTPLPGIERHLMILNGCLKLVHQGIRERMMEPYKDVDSFLGDWQTESWGKVTDFNLMTKNGAKGQLKFFETDTGSVLNIPAELNPNMVVIYVIDGRGEILQKPVEEKTVLVAEKDILDKITVVPQNNTGIKLAVSWLNVSESV